MNGKLAKGLAAGVVLAVSATAVPASAQQVVLTPEERVVVYRDLVAQPYPYSYYYYDDYAYSAPVYSAPPAYYEPAPRWAVQVGAVVPAAVPLVPVPQTVAVPDIYGYDYAVVEEQVVLVEPRSRQIFQVLYETD